MCLCGVSLSLAVLYLCTYKALGQIPPTYGGYNSAPTVQFSSSSFTVYEGDSAQIQVACSTSGFNLGPVTVNYATSDGTGLAGVDYTATNGTLPFDPNYANWFYVYTLDDPNNTSWVTVNLALSSPTNATLGSPSTATLYVLNPAVCSLP